MVRIDYGRGSAVGRTAGRLRQLPQLRAPNRQTVAAERVRQGLRKTLDAIALPRGLRLVADRCRDVDTNDSG